MRMDHSAFNQGLRLKDDYLQPRDLLIVLLLPITGQTLYQLARAQI